MPGTYIPLSDYRAPAYLPGGHFQTVGGAFCFAPRIDYVREEWRTPDRDFIHVDWAGEDERPLLVLFHGLEGKSDALYARKLAARALERQWRFAVPHFRGCSGVPNRQLRSYHAGASEEVDWMLREFRARHRGPIYAAGVSLGANALLKWLGERGAAALGMVQRAAAISAPFDLHANGAKLARGASLLYAKFFLASTLRRRALEKLDRYPGAYDARLVRKAGTLREFDEIVTAPVHGFRDARDYWTRNSSLRFLAGIRAPTLLINARNDPFLPPHVLRAVETLRDAGVLPQELELAFQDEGGHAAFPGSSGWLQRRVLDFLAQA